MGDEFLSYADDEAYIVRRLGTAFVSLWPEIPEDIREQIVGKSLVVVDAYDAAQLEEKIETSSPNMRVSGESGRAGKIDGLGTRLAP